MNTSALFAQSYDQKTLSVYFPSNGDQLNSNAKTDIRQAFLEIHPKIIREIYIEGHTDSDASLSYNLNLSARRAANTQEYLLTQGVKSDIIKIGHSEKVSPLVPKRIKIGVY